LNSLINKIYVVLVENHAGKQREMELMVPDVAQVWFTNQFETIEVVELIAFL
jgi:hypothetical protein